MCTSVTLWLQVGGFKKKKKHVTFLSFIWAGQGTEGQAAECLRELSQFNISSWWDLLVWEGSGVKSRGRECGGNIHTCWGKKKTCLGERKEKPAKRKCLQEEDERKRNGAWSRRRVECWQVEHVYTHSNRDGELGSDIETLQLGKTQTSTHGFKNRSQI